MKNQIVSQHFKRNDLAVFKKGDILGYCRDPENAPHHSTGYGGQIETAQKYAFFWSWLRGHIDPSVTHICLILGQKNEGEVLIDGRTSLDTVDTLAGEDTLVRPVEHNYKCRAFHLRDDFKPHANFTSQALREKAVDIAMLFLKLPYNTEAAKSAFVRSVRGRSAVDREYTQELVQRFKLENNRDPVPPPEGLMCTELLLVSYQIAYLLLASEEAKNEALPPWLNYHARSAPALAFSFFGQHPEAYEELPQSVMLLLRYDGQPHINDLKDPVYLRKSGRGGHSEADEDSDHSLNRPLLSTLKN